ncbi:MAG: hypothetical protein IJN99_02650 [Clostridia bacterium]|nr:hypothetical protein [Clostridia bacterium]
MQNKNCSFYQQQILDYFSDLLGEKESSALMSHIQSCPQCRSEFEELQAILDAASALPEKEVPHGLKEAVYQKLEDVTPAKAAISHKWRRLVSVAVPLVACAVLAIGIYQGGIYEKFVGSDNIISVVPETNNYSTDSATETNDTETADTETATSKEAPADTGVTAKAVAPAEKTPPAAEEIYDKSDSGNATSPVASGGGGSSSAAAPKEEANTSASFAQENSPELAEQPLPVNAGRMAVPAFDEAEEDISATSTDEKPATEESLSDIPLACTVTADDISVFTEDTLSEDDDKIYISVSAEEWESFKSFALSQGASLNFTYSEGPVDFVSVTIRKR